MLGGERESAACTRATTTNGHRRAREIRNKEKIREKQSESHVQAQRDTERCAERCCTHSGVGRAVGVTGVWGLRVVMQVFLVVRQIMLQTSGPLTTTATAGPTGAEAWTHGHWLTAAVTSDRCAGLVGGGGGMERGNRENREVSVEERRREED